MAGLSLGPSDSVSQNAGSTPKEVNVGGALRPDTYQRSVLWNIEDCQYYGLVTEKNSSRPPMEKCIRNSQGEPVSTSVYNAIKATARMLVNVHLVPLGTPADPAARTKTKTKTYYKKYFLQNFRDVLDKLEAQEPLLTLCASRWKAEHIIANCLTAIVDNAKSAKKKSVEEEGQESDDEKLDAQSAKRQRTKSGASEREGSKKKKRRNRGESSSKGVPKFCSLFFSCLSIRLSLIASSRAYDFINRTTDIPWATKNCRPRCLCRCKQVQRAKSKSSLAVFHTFYQWCAQH